MLNLNYGQKSIYDFQCKYSLPLLTTILAVWPMGITPGGTTAPLCWLFSEANYLVCNPRLPAGTCPICTMAAGRFKKATLEKNNLQYP